MEMYGKLLDTSEVTPDVLANKLSKFYAVVKPHRKPKKKRETKALEVENNDQIYHKNTLINIRSAINRHLTDIGRGIDIVQDEEFKTANRTLNGQFKKRMVCHLVDIGKEIDIVQDEEYKKANSALNVQFKKRMVKGKSKETTHQPEIISPDLIKKKPLL